MRRTVTSRGPSRVATRAASLLLLGLAACSPYSYSKEVSAISAGVDDLSTGFSDGYTQLAADREAQSDLDLVSTRSQVAVAPSCDNAKIKAPCLVFKRGSPEPVETDVERKRGDTLVALSVLKNYVHALAAVSNANDRSAYDAAVSQLSGAVGQLAQSANGVAPGASIVAPAAINFVGWAFGTALDQQRFDSLKAGVTAAGTAAPGRDAPIAVVAKTLGGGLKALSDQRVGILTKEIITLSNRLQPKLSDADYRQGLSDLKAAIAAQYGLQHADPEAAATALVDAHNALLAALNDPNRGYPTLLTTVDNFVSKAEALRAAFVAASTPAKSASTTGS